MLRSWSMPRRRIWRAGLCLALALALGGPRPAAACSCVPPSPPAVAFGDSPAVFSGTVTRIGPNSGGIFARLFEPLRLWLGLAPPPSAYALTATVQVITAWKGITSTPVSILTAASSASCGYVFAAGQQYLIYAISDSGQLSTNMCTRTAELSQAPADLAFLNSRPPLTVTPAAGAGSLLLGLALVAPLAAAGLLGLWALRLRRRRSIAAS